MTQILRYLHTELKSLSAIYVLLPAEESQENNNISLEKTLEHNFFLFSCLLFFNANNLILRMSVSTFLLSLSHTHKDKSACIHTHTLFMPHQHRKSSLTHFNGCRKSIIIDLTSWTFTSKLIFLWRHYYVVWEYVYWINSQKWNYQTKGIMHFQFWEILSNWLCSSCINLYFHQQCMRVHVFLIPPSTCRVIEFFWLC